MNDPTPHSRRILMSVDTLEEYEKVLPGAADRIMKTSSEEVEHNKRMSILCEDLKQARSYGSATLLTTGITVLLEIVSCGRARGDSLYISPAAPEPQIIKVHPARHFVILR